MNSASVLRDYISPEEIARQLKRLYGGAACVEALWHLQWSSNNNIENRRFWRDVLTFLDVPTGIEPQLTPAQVAKLYSLHLADPRREARIRIQEARLDRDQGKKVFWRMVLQALYRIRRPAPVAKHRQ